MALHNYPSMGRFFFIFIYLIPFAFSCHHGSEDYVADKNRLEQRLDSALGEVMRVYDLPGLAVGVIRGNKIIYARGFGVKRLGSADTIGVQSSFHMASVSKPFVAMGILQLADRGRLSLDSPLTRYIPYFKMKDPRYTRITIRQMLTHTSGFPDVKDYGWDKPQFDEEALERYIRDSVAEENLLFDPGTQFAYSNMAYDVLPEVIRQLSHMPFETYMKKNVFAPCGMNNSTFLFSDIPPGTGTSPHILGSSCRFEVSAIYPYNRAHAGSSTLHSDVEDMLKWERMIINGGQGILSATSFKSMLSPQHAIDRYSSYGFGFFLEEGNGKMLIEHSGGDVGYSSYAGIIPTDSLGIVFMSNLHRFVPYDMIRNILFDAVYGLPLPILRKPISSVLAPLICTESFTKVREKYLNLKSSHSGDYDFGWEWLNALGAAYQQLGEMNKAIEALKLNAEAYPTSDSFLALGNAYLKNHQKNQAVESLKDALKANPHCANCARILDNIAKSK